jgi:hypothetical protein
VNAPLVQPPTYVELTFSAAARTPYHLWIRGRALNDCWCNDSAWVQFDDTVDAHGLAVDRIGSSSGEMYSIEECLNCGVSGWGWNDNHWGAVGALGPAIVFATSGVHTIRLQPREDGLSIDQVVLSSNHYLNEPPGANKDDRTIVPR